MNENTESSFVRWHALLVSQFSYVVNLLIVLSMSTIGFSLSLLFNKDFLPVEWSKYFFTSSLFSHLFSMGFGIWCNINRLHDFRLTKDIVSKRLNGTKDQEIGNERQETKKLGKYSWLLFWGQLIMFCLGTLMLMTSLMIINRSKLF